jgi:polypyrimidine tract-binding protein 2
MLFAGGNSSDAQPNRILLVTVHQVLYPMTVDVLHQVFSPYGYVEKIVTFQKSAGQILRFLYLYLSFLMKRFCLWVMH